MLTLDVVELGVVACVLYALGFVSCSILVLGILSSGSISVTAAYLSKVGFLYRSFTNDRRRGRR
jgi:hypothetical protein